MSGTLAEPGRATEPRIWRGTVQRVEYSGPNSGLRLHMYRSRNPNIEL